MQENGGPKLETTCISEEALRSRAVETELEKWARKSNHLGYLFQPFYSANNSQSPRQVNRWFCQILSLPLAQIPDKVFNRLIQGTATPDINSKPWLNLIGTSTPTPNTYTPNTHIPDVHTHTYPIPIRPISIRPIPTHLIPIHLGMWIGYGCWVWVLGVRILTCLLLVMYRCTLCFCQCESPFTILGFSPGPVDQSSFPAQDLLSIRNP